MVKRIRKEYGTREPINKKEVDIKQQRTQRLKWVLKWIVAIPLSVYFLWWFLIYLADAFSYMN